MNIKLIDVWKLDTYDTELLDELRLYAQLIQDYMNTESQLFVERIAADRRSVPPTNPHHGKYLWLIEHIMDYMKSRTIRAWHYTRLTDEEVETLRRTGVYPSTLETTHQRLNARVLAGVLSAEIADALFDASPFRNSTQLKARGNKFWMVSNPLESDDDRVEFLLGNWGGEAVYFGLKDTKLKSLVANLGEPGVLEIAVPISVTNHAYGAAEAVLGAYGLSLGCSPERETFDLHSTSALGPDAVIAVHTEGEPDFAVLGRGYPVGFACEQSESLSEA